MLTRRHIRVKVLQSLYAFNQGDHQDTEKQEKFLFYSINQMHELYVLLLQSMVSLREHAEGYLLKSQKKHLATEKEKNPSRNFIDNQLLHQITSHDGLRQLIQNKKLNYWKDDDEYIAILFNEMVKTDFYAEYLAIEKPSFKDDRDFVVQLYKKVIAPNEKLYEYLEDKRLTWLDDYPIVNTVLVKVLSKVNKDNIASKLIPDLYKNEEDRDFARDLLRKVLVNDEDLTAEIDGKTPNWDKERIADLDMIILKMGIAEFLYFPSIPVRASINEYLEIAKEYSTPKSSLFINGILDKMVKDFTESGKLNKIGRGLR
ncbi:transcription antitermination factor NusB [Aureitalea sp. L0-47]|uniref:transcription antitermination factor NusB n=1 Tax=Aureitalea sp. L0-47 TaxID=2816962 RepID=UPI002236F829|nr:transcription antitermination factor NusB [Aureitalea sp. L0-47]MCW5519143.1 transcription antitermination factor NusB [Aureitalea sp. L0-47]